MKDKVFIDTNIFVYAFLDSEQITNHAKHQNAVRFLSQFDSNTEVIISIQVLNEYYSALLKNKINDSEIQQSAQNLGQAINVVPISKKTVFDSYSIRNRYQFSYWDSLIIASALEHDCAVLFSEDMQHDQCIEERLRIINPFLQ